MTAGTRRTAPATNSTSADAAGTRTARSPPRASRRRPRSTAATRRGPSPGTGRRATSPTRSAAGPGPSRAAARTVRMPAASISRFVGEVRRQEDHDQDLAELRRLEATAGRSSTHRRAPLIVLADAGHDRQQQHRPARPGRSCTCTRRASGRRARARASARTRPSPTPSHTTCSTARSGFSRQITANPSAESSAAAGNSTGSARRANRPHREPCADEPRRDQRAVQLDARRHPAVLAEPDQRVRADARDERQTAATRCRWRRAAAVRWWRRGSWPARRRGREFAPDLLDDRQRLRAIVRRDPVGQRRVLRQLRDIGTRGCPSRAPRART